ncbi:MAG: hypothetical protein QM758_15775 [Armatimonas sp.]
MDAAEAASIRKLIHQLVTVDKPNFGLSPSTSGVVLGPIPSPELTGSPLKELVRIGPRALPFLLEALEDSTPTRLIIEKLGKYTLMPQFDNEMGGNPANAQEQKILSEKPRRGMDQFMEKDPPTCYQVTIGDICFVIIGQIVGRYYEAVHYQASGTIVINSPTHDPSIVKAVRAIWSSDNPTQHIFDSLLLDYSMSGTNATMLLLYYFPRQIAPIIAQRIKSMLVYYSGLNHRESDSEVRFAWLEKQERVNGVRTKDFIETVRWCREPEIRAALLYLFQKSNDSEILLALLPAIDGARHWPLIESRFQFLLGQLRPTSSDWNGINGFEMLVPLREVGGDKARPCYRKYLRSNSTRRRFAVCTALQGTNGDWDREFLWPMLTDKRFDREHASQYPPNSRERRRPRRVCDYAAGVIAKHRKDVVFNRMGTTAELDHQIQQMQRQLTKRK